MLGLAPDGSSLTQNDAARLPFPSRSTDLVLLPFMLFHLSDPREALLEARRVLRDGGHVGTATWSFGFDSVAERICDEEFDRFGASKLEYDVTFTDHERVDSPSKMSTLLESAGLKCRRSWVGIHEHRFDVEGLIGMRTQIGRSRRRFESLGSLRKDAFLTSVRRRLEALPVKDFIARAGVVYSTASVV